MIHVDFTMTHRDLFRASLELSRGRLIIGGLIVLASILPMLWLFWLLEDLRFFLFEVSPLFIGFPLLAFGGQLLRAHATYRKSLKKLPESQRRLQYHFDESADGYDVIHGDSFSHWVWRDLTKVVEKRDYFVFNIHGARTLLLKNGFHQSSDIALFRQILTTQLGKKAKLQSVEAIS